MVLYRWLGPIALKSFENILYSPDSAVKILIETALSYSIIDD